MQNPVVSTPPGRLYIEPVQSRAEKRVPELLGLIQDDDREVRACASDGNRVGVYACPTSKLELLKQKSQEEGFTFVVWIEPQGGGPLEHSSRQDAHGTGTAPDPRPALAALFKQGVLTVDSPTIRHRITGST